MRRVVHFVTRGRGVTSCHRCITKRCRVTVGSSGRAARDERDPRRRSPAATGPSKATATPWQQTACILCECNCGIEVRLGGEDGRRFERIRGDKAHPGSQGYTCEKALRLDHYQNGRHRLTAPLRRRADGTFEEIDWDTAIARSPRGSRAVRDAHGGESIFYYGGGGQGNHLGGAYSGATLRALGVALPLERAGAGEDRRVLGRTARCSAPTCGPTSSTPRWRSSSARTRGSRHGFPRARTTLKEIAHDPERAPDRDRPAPHRDRRAGRLPPRRSGRAPTPGCLAALGAVLVAGGPGRPTRGWPSTPTGSTRSSRRSAPCRSRAYATIAASTRSCVRATARRIAAAASVAVFEDLGVQMYRCTRRSRATSRSCCGCSPATSPSPGAQYVPTSARRHRQARRAVSDGEADATSARWSARGSSPGSCRATSSPTRSSPTTRTATGRCSSRAATRRTRWPTATGCARRCVARAARRDRRRDDRDGAPRRLRAARAVAVREVGGDVLQLRLPAQRLPPAPAAARARPTACCPSPRSTPAWSRRSAR